MKKIFLTIGLLVAAITLNAQLRAFMIQGPEKALPGIQKISIMKFQNSGIRITTTGTKMHTETIFRTT